MNYQELLRKKTLYEQAKPTLPEYSVKSYEKAIDIEYAHNSTAIEGNTLTLIETKLVLEDKIAVGGKNLRELFEVINHEKAFAYVKSQIAQGNRLDESIVKNIHSLLMENIFVGGI